MPRRLGLGQVRVRCRQQAARGCGGFGHHLDVVRSVSSRDVVEFFRRQVTLGRSLTLSAQGDMAPLGIVATGSAFMSRPVAEDQLLMIVSMSLRI